MKQLIILLSITTGLLLTGCSSGDEDHSHGEGADHSHEQQTEQTAQQNEHGHPHDDTGESEHEGVHDQEGEEADKELGLEETYDNTRKGIRLILSYNDGTESFTGSIENTTEEALPQIRVEVHLSNGTELGPTTAVDLDAGESQSVELNAAGETFERWTAHPEMGSSEHSHGEGSEHSHDN